MSARPVELERCAPEPRPLYLRVGSGWAFAFLHPPAGERARAPAVLLCESFGCDRMLLHLTYRHLALRLSALGFWVLRVDYPGTGDAEGSPREAGQWPNYLDTLHRAADALREWSGADQVALFGALLGGSLAAVVASQRSDVAALVCWGPYVQGGAFLREQQALTTLHQGSTPAAPPTSPNAGEQEALGFLVTRELTDALRGLRLGELELARVPHACVIPRSNDSREGTLVAALQRAGSQVCAHADPLFPYEPLTEPEAPLPEPVLSHVTDWMQTTFRARGLRIGDIEVDGTRARDSVVLDAQGGESVRETPVWFGANPRMFGIVAEPATPRGDDRDLPAVVIVNGGNNHRAGINRNATEWARDWSALGFRVLRLDLRGLGDSPPDRPHALNILYRDATRRDLREALDFLEREYGHRRFVLMGLCAGGYQSFQYALRDPRVAEVVLVSPLRLCRIPHWRQILRQCLPRGRRLAAVNDPGTRERVFDLARGVLARAPEWVARPHGGELRSSLERLTGAGVRVLILLDGDGQARDWLGRSLRAVRPIEAENSALEIVELPDSNHIFSGLQSQAALTALLTERLRAHLGRAVRAAGPPA